MTLTHTTAYRAGLALAVLSSLFLVWVALALGIVGIEGDPYDLLYVGAIGVAVIGAIAARLRAEGMARAMFVTAVAFAPAAAVALIAGKHRAVYSSVGEILGLSAMFAVLFLAAAWLFRRAADAELETAAGRRH
jgi:hypothetical protein